MKYAVVFFYFDCQIPAGVQENIDTFEYCYIMFCDVLFLKNTVLVFSQQFTCSASFRVVFKPKQLDSSDVICCNPSSAFCLVYSNVIRKVIETGRS